MQTRQLIKSHRLSRYVAPGRLNDDILLSIIAISPLPAATSMMVTCQFFYHEGAKIILRDTPVSFDEKMSESKALALLRFIQAEHLSRCSHIRKLHVLMPTLPDILAKALIQLVPRMSSLKILVVAIEDALDSHPDLLLVFSSLRSVDNLAVVNAGERSCELVRSFQSPLVEAEIFFDPIGRRSLADLSSKTSCHPLVMLQHSAATLTTLFASFLVDSNIRLVFVRPPDVVYPALHTLVLRDCSSLSLAPYVRCCPNLAHLCVRYQDQTPWDDRFHAGPGPIPGSGLSAIQREMNLTLPERLSLDPLTRDGARGEGPPTWKGLKEYIGPLMDLWIFGLTCPIARLTLEDAFTRMSSGARAPGALTDVLAYARPAGRAIVFRRCALTEVLATDLLAALATEGAVGLRSLMLAVWVRRGDRELDVGRALDKIVEAVSHLNLTRLDIGVNYGGIDGEEEAELSRLFPWLAAGTGPEATGAAATPHPHLAGDAHTPTPTPTHAHTNASGSTSSDDHDSPTPSSASDTDSDSDEGSASGEDSDADSGSGGESDSDSAGSNEELGLEPEAVPLTLGERTLDAVDVPAFATRLADAIPTLEDSMVAVHRPRRSGARLRIRTALFGRVAEGTSAGEGRWVGDVLYQETEGPCGV